MFIYQQPDAGLSVAQVADIDQQREAVLDQLGADAQVQVMGYD